MERKTDAALVADALAGRREAFAALVRRYQDYAYGLAIGYLSDFDLARDVVQEAFLCAYRDLGKLREPARFGGWLRGIVRNMAHRALRELHRVRTLAGELGHAVEPTSSEPPPDVAAERAERRRTVRRALERLNARNREAVSLYYVDGLSYAEIAAFLDVTEAAVQGRLQRARNQLRKELAMVEEEFKERELPEDFSDEIQRLLDEASERGEQHKLAIRRLAEIGAPAVDPLCEALDDPRVPVRRAAAQALCRIGDRRALRPILGLLYAEASWKAELWLTGRALAIPGVREALLEVLGKGQRAEQGYAMAALSHALGDEAVFERILRVFRHPGEHPGLSQAALSVCCHVRPEAAGGLILEALRRPDRRLQATAAWEALRRGVTVPIGDCLPLFGRGTHWWGRVCAGRLALQHGEEGRRAIKRLLREGPPAERCTAAMALAATGDAEAFEALREGLLGAFHDRNWAKAVSRALALQFGGKLADWAEADPDAFLRAPAVLWTLAKGEPRQYGPWMEFLAAEGTPSVRAAALRILARQRRADFLPELRRCLREGRPRKVAQEAFRQMLRLGDQAEPVALEMFESERWTERKAAAALLRRWGKLTAQQKGRAEQDPHVAVRHAARRRPQE